MTAITILHARACKTWAFLPLGGNVGSRVVRAVRREDLKEVEHIFFLHWIIIFFLKIILFLNSISYPSNIWSIIDDDADDGEVWNGLVWYGMLRWFFFWWKRIKCTVFRIFISFSFNFFYLLLNSLHSFLCKFSILRNEIKWVIFNFFYFSFFKIKIKILYYTFYNLKFIIGIM